MCDFIKLTIKLAKRLSPVIIENMNKTPLVTSQIKEANKPIRSSTIKANNSNVKCVIANDAARKIDFLILIIETLQINANDSLLLKARDIGLSDEFSSRVQFWKMRCSNPLRKTYTFSSLSSDQVDSLVELISSMAEYLYPLIRQLLSSKESNTMNKERWHLFSSRLKSLIRERMNLQRSFIISLLSDESNDYFRHLLVILSLSCGEGGAKRLNASLYYQT